MTIEIERKFLVLNQDWRALSHERRVMVQGYLSSAANATVRVRVSGDAALLTIKGGRSGLQCREFEYPIPLVDARVMLDHLAVGRLISKTRHYVRHAGFVWEVDEFSGANTGLVIAEVELEQATDCPPLPAWVGPEVTHDPRYFNSYLSRMPYQDWDHD